MFPVSEIAHWGISNTFCESNNTCKFLGKLAKGSPKSMNSATFGMNILAKNDVWIFLNDTDVLFNTSSIDIGIKI